MFNRYLATGIVVLCCAARSSNAASLVSEGFESYSPGNFFTSSSSGVSTNSNGWFGLVSDPQGQLDANVQATTVHAGTHALTIGPRDPLANQNSITVWQPTPWAGANLAADPFINSSVWMNRSQPTGDNPENGRSGFTGLVAYGMNSFGQPTIIGGVGLLAGASGYQYAYWGMNGQFSAGPTGMGLGYIPDASVAAAGTDYWQSYSLQMNFTTHTFNVAWGGFGIADLPFVNVSVDPNQRAVSLSEVNMEIDGHFFDSTSFDDFGIAAAASAPEPASVGSFALLAVVGFGRARSARTKSFRR